MNNFFSSDIFFLGNSTKTIASSIDGFKSSVWCSSDLASTRFELSPHSNCCSERSCSRLLGCIWAAQHERYSWNQRISTHLWKRQQYAFHSFSGLVSYPNHQTTTHCKSFNFICVCTKFINYKICAHFICWLHHFRLVRFLSLECCCSAALAITKLSKSQKQNLSTIFHVTWLHMVVFVWF